MEIKLGNLGKGYASFWCWLMGPGSVFGSSEAVPPVSKSWFKVENQQSLLHSASSIQAPTHQIAFSF